MPVVAAALLTVAEFLAAARETRSSDTDAFAFLATDALPLDIVAAAAVAAAAEIPEPRGFGAWAAKDAPAMQTSAIKKEKFRKKSNNFLFKIRSLSSILSFLDKINQELNNFEFIPVFPQLIRCTSI
jgi:hypothetical protein